MALPSLDPARLRFESLMLDFCSATVDPDGVDNATYDPLTHRLVGAGIGTEQLYEGKCLIRLDNGGTKENSGAVLALDRYDVLIPFDAEPRPVVGADVLITDSHDAPEYIGRTFTVLRVDVHPAGFGCILKTQERTEVPRRERAG